MRTIGTVVVTAIIISMFWLVYFGVSRSPTAVPQGAGLTIQSDRKDGGGRAAVADAPRRTAPQIGADKVVVGPAGLAIPVPAINAGQLTDTFTAARGGGLRTHDAIDIMAPDGTPIIATAPGTIEKLFYSNGGGGLTIYQRSDDGGWTFYYAHLSAYVVGLHDGQRVKRGEVIGFVGHSGDASPDGPHLHFAINRMAPGDKWYQGAAVNPYPLLAGPPVTR